MASAADKDCCNSGRTQLFGELTGSRGALRPTKTVVTRVDGSQVVEVAGSLGQPEQRAASTEATPAKVLGYVCDKSENLDVGNPMPALYISGGTVATRRDILDRFGITHILNLSGQQNSFVGDLTYLSVDMVDDLSQPLGAHIVSANDFIGGARCDGGNVLVHCAEGVSRSAAIVAAYIIREKRISPAAAVQLIRQTRWVQPNDSFMKQLAEYHAQLKATW